MSDGTITPLVCLLLGYQLPPYWVYQINNTILVFGPGHISAACNFGLICLDPNIKICWHLPFTLYYYYQKGKLFMHVLYRRDYLDAGYQSLLVTYQSHPTLGELNLGLVPDWLLHALFLNLPWYLPYSWGFREERTSCLLCSLYSISWIIQYVSLILAILTLFWIPPPLNYVEKDDLALTRTPLPNFLWKYTHVVTLFLIVSLFSPQNYSFFPLEHPFSLLFNFLLLHHEMWHFLVHYQELRFFTQLL